MEKWIAGLFGRRVVYLKHFDSEVEKKWAKPTPYGLVCKSIGQDCLLMDDGTVDGPCWLDGWRAAA